MSSCASIFCGSKAKVTFDGEISEEATLTIDGLKHTNVTFPYTTKIRRGFDETVVKIESPNYTASPIIINKNAGTTERDGRNDAKRLCTNVVTVSDEVKPKKRKMQGKAEYSRRTVCKSLPKKM